MMGMVDINGMTERWTVSGAEPVGWNGEVVAVRTGGKGYNILAKPK